MLQSMFPTVVRSTEHRIPVVRRGELPMSSSARSENTSTVYLPSYLVSHWPSSSTSTPPPGDSHQAIKTVFTDSIDLRMTVSFKAFHSSFHTHSIILC